MPEIDTTRLLTDRYDLVDSHTYSVAEKAGAYTTARKVLTSVQPRSRPPTFAAAAAQASPRA